MTALYQSQRAMRAMRRAAMQRGVIAILDVGSAKIACLVLRFDGADRLIDGDGVGSLAGQSEYRVIGAATTRSRGVRFGRVDSMQETERGIRTAVQAAQKMAGLRVDHVIACISGGGPRSYGLAGSVDLDGAAIDKHDVARVMAATDAPDYGAGREVLHAQPVNFAIDHRTGMADPLGQIGNRLSCDMHILTIDGSVIANVLQCVKRCDLELAGLASSAYASGVSSLVEDEQELGAACIDMGGDHVTADISKALQVPMATAERIKTIHGGLMATSMDDRDMIELGGETGDWELDRRAVSRAELIGIIRPRVEEILEDVRARLDVAGFDSLPSQQIVLTGGNSQLPGLDALAPRILGQQVRIGRPMRVQGLPQAASGAGFSAAVGLCLFAAHPQDEWWDFDIPANAYPVRSLRRAVRWFKDNW